MQYLKRAPQSFFYCLGEEKKITRNCIQHMDDCIVRNLNLLPLGFAFHNVFNFLLVVLVVGASSRR